MSLGSKEGLEAEVLRLRQVEGQLLSFMETLSNQLSELRRTCSNLTMELHDNRLQAERTKTEMEIYKQQARSWKGIALAKMRRPCRHRKRGEAKEAQGADDSSSSSSSDSSNSAAEDREEHPPAAEAPAAAAPPAAAAAAAAALVARPARTGRCTCKQCPWSACPGPILEGYQCQGCINHNLRLSKDWRDAKGDEDPPPYLQCDLTPDVDWPSLVAGHNPALLADNPVQGMAPNAISKIFESFQPGDLSLTDGWNVKESLGSCDLYKEGPPTHLVFRTWNRKADIFAKKGGVWIPVAWDGTKRIGYVKHTDKSLNEQHLRMALWYHVYRQNQPPSGMMHVSMVVAEMQIARQPPLGTTAELVRLAKDCIVARDKDINNWLPAALPANPGPAAPGALAVYPGPAAPGALAAPDVIMQHDLGGEGAAAP